MFLHDIDETNKQTKKKKILKSEQIINEQFRLCSFTKKKNLNEYTQSSPWCVVKSPITVYEYGLNS